MENQIAAEMKKNWAPLAMALVALVGLFAISAVAVFSSRAADREKNELAGQILALQEKNEELERRNETQRLMLEGMPTDERAGAIRDRALRDGRASCPSTECPVCPQPLMSQLEQDAVACEAGTASAKQVYEAAMAKLQASCDAAEAVGIGRRAETDTGDPPWIDNPAARRAARRLISAHMDAERAWMAYNGARSTCIQTLNDRFHGIPAVQRLHAGGAGDLDWDRFHELSAKVEEMVSYNALGECASTEVWWRDALACDQPAGQDAR